MLRWEVSEMGGDSASDGVTKAVRGRVDPQRRNTPPPSSHTSSRLPGMRTIAAGFDTFTIVGCCNKRMQQPISHDNRDLCCSQVCLQPHSRGQ